MRERVGGLNAVDVNGVDGGQDHRLGGTITSAITAQGSGTSRNPIIVYWEPGAIVEAPVCSGSGDGAYGCVDLHGQRNITLNGGSNGIIESTANGTAMANHTNYADGVYAENCSGCTIENLTIKNMYVERAGSNDCSADSQGNVGIWYSGSNTTITHDTFANEADGAMLDTIARSDTNMVISHDTFTNVGTGMNWVSNTNGGGHAGPILFDNNTLTGFNVWDTGVRDCYHQDGIHCWDGVGFTPMHYGAGMFIYDNVESGMDSTANANGYMFMEGGSGSGATVCADSTSPIYAFNNVISGIGSNGLLGVYSGEPVALNNTFLGGSSDTGVCWSANSDAVNTEFENNAVQGCGNLMANDKASIYATGQPNHNQYANSSSNAFVCTTNFVAFASFASWQSCARASLGGGSSAETKSSRQTSLALNADGSPQRGSPLIGAGANLTRLCTRQPHAALYRDQRECTPRYGRLGRRRVLTYESGREQLEAEVRVALEMRHLMAGVVRVQQRQDLVGAGRVCRWHSTTIARTRLMP